jgi:3-hexulose-6-phosphate synthase
LGSLVERLRECGHLLQVALDFTDLRDAVRVGSLTSLGPAVILEAGTPLIKSEGMRSVDILRSLPGEHLVMADTKTADVGGLEAKLAFEHGADAMSVLAASSEETIKEAVREAESAGKDVYVDLIGFTELDSWLKKAKGAGAHVAVIHIGIDVQRALGITAAQATDIVRRAKEVFGGPVAVAGGIKPSDVSALAAAGADIIIIGSAITKSSDPAAAAKAALDGLRPRCQ